MGTTVAMRWAVSRHVMLLCGLTATATLLGRTAHAKAPDSAPKRLDLTWDAPTSCAAASDVEAAVGRLLGPSPTASSGSALRVQGRVREQGGRFRVILAIAEGEERSERTVDAPSCELATEAAVVVIAMLVPRGSPAPVTVTRTDPPGAVMPESDRTFVPRSVAPALWLGFGGFADAGMFRTMAPGVVGSVAWRAPRLYGLRAELGGSSTPERPIHLWRLSTRGELWVGETTAVGGAAGFDTGLLHGREADIVWLAVCGGPLVRRTVAERLALGAALELVVPLAGPTARIANDPEYKPKAIAARATISVELGF